MKRNILILLSLFICFPLFAQLNDFSLDIVVTNETCEDNGTLTFNITNGTPGATFLFTVYKLPDTVNPIEVTTNTTVSNLDSGTYQVVAIQSLAGESNSVTQEVEIVNAIAPLTYEISSVSQNCSTGGLVEINTLTGTAAQYEIITGPELRPLQTSNIFEGLPEGTYNFRVFDDCGQGVVTTYTLVLEPAIPVVTPPAFENVLSTGCDSVIITNTITYPASVAISYPITVTYTIHPPDGSPDIVETVSYTDGAPNMMELEHEINLYGDQPFTYDILITNSCGNQYGNTGMPVNPLPGIADTLMSLPCGQFYFVLDVSNYSPPFTLDLQSDAAGFNPSDFNTGYPGPYTNSSLVFGGEGNPTPAGNYTATVTDACGRTASIDFELQLSSPSPVAVGRNNGCYSDLGRIQVSISDRDLVFAEIIAGPPAYISQHPEPLPHDVSSFINSNGKVNVTNVPVGDYVIRVTDECGNVYELPVTVPVFVERDFTAETLADCTIGLGAVRISSGNGALIEINIINAPSDYNGPIDDLSEFISSQGIFFMDALPEGNYTFSGTDICGIQRAVTVTVQGYQASDDPFTFIPNCGSFDIAMSDVDNTSESPTYWLQMLNDDGEWVNPVDGTVYPEGTIPTEDNSFPLPNGTTTFNLTFSGDFRIVKAFESFGGAQQTKNCIIELGTFNYLNQPRINGVYKLSCSDNPDDILIDADGIAPLHYTITEKDGQPFSFDNGTNNVFSGLAPASYRFKVEDGCGAINTIVRTINTLPDLVVANQPDNLFECVEPGQPLDYIFDLSQQNPVILGDQGAGSYTLTYHLTQQDAEAGTNALPEQFESTSPSIIIYARLIHNQITICYDIVTFTLSLGNTPVLDLQPTYYLCEDSFVRVSAGEGYDSYSWSNGATTPYIFVLEPGEYSVTVTDGSCSATESINVLISQPANSISVDTEDWTFDENRIMAVAYGTGVYEYSLDGENFQSEGTFDHLEAGLYTIYIRDINGCGVIEREVALLNYPKFFTPNGDGINETWRIPFSWFEEELSVVIMDRYGKVITSFDAESPGWDGTYNGRNLPSTDYWFIVNREDGRVLKGHFSMVR